jgi:hypothetical protein
MSAMDTKRVIYTGQAADMSAFLTEVTLTTWSVTTCITHTRTTVMITDLLP